MCTSLGGCRGCRLGRAAAGLPRSQVSTESRQNAYVGSCAVPGSPVGRCRRGGRFGRAVGSVGADPGGGSGQLVACGLGGCAKLACCGPCWRGGVVGSHCSRLLHALIASPRAHLASTPPDQVSGAALAPRASAQGRRARRRVGTVVTKRRISTIWRQRGRHLLQLPGGPGGAGRGRTRGRREPTGPRRERGSGWRRLWVGYRADLSTRGI